MNALTRTAVPWLYRAPMWQVISVAISGGLLVFAVTVVVEWWLCIHLGAVIETMLLSSWVAGALTFYLLYRIICYGRSRRALLLHRLEVISETNHHIRNAMEVVQMSAYLSGEQTLIESVAGATARIEWALRDILGSTPPR